MGGPGSLRFVCRALRAGNNIFLPCSVLSGPHSRSQLACAGSSTADQHAHNAWGAENQRAACHARPYAPPSRRRVDPARGDRLWRVLWNGSAERQGRAISSRRAACNKSRPVVVSVSAKALPKPRSVVANADTMRLTVGYTNQRKYLLIDTQCGPLVLAEFATLVVNSSFSLRQLRGLLAFQPHNGCLRTTF